jgi:hypothetical protein
MAAGGRISNIFGCCLPVESCRASSASLQNFRGLSIWLLMDQVEEKLQHIDPEHPPDEKYRDDCTCDMDEPVGGSLRFAEIEHGGIVAREVT